MRYFSKAMLVASAALCLNLSAYSQDISLKINNVTVKEAMERIKKDTGYSFVFSSKDVNTNQRVTVSVSDATIEEVIKQILKGQEGLDYEIQGKKIVLRKTQPVSTNGTIQQNNVVTGRVLDSKGEPVIGATILEKGTTNGTVSDFDGNFSLNVSNNNAVLHISYVGFQSKSVKATLGKILSVEMEEDSKLLDEVTIVGYGVQKKVNLTGAVASIDYSEKIGNRPVMNIGTSLAGMTAGMSVMQGGGGQPGSDNATIRIRGNGTLNSNVPLVLVDGMECTLADVDPNDIASISILKDAGSAAIYGSRAANGVILVTTKNGSEGKVNVNYSYSGIVQNAYNDLKFINSYADYMSLTNEASENMGYVNPYSDGNIQKWAEAEKNPNGIAENGLPNYMVYPNTDWFKEVFNTGFSQEHSLSLSGGTQKVKYLISGRYLDNKGIINKYGLDSGIRRINFRTNVEANPFKWLKIGTRIFGQRQENGLCNVDNGFKYLYLTSPGIYVGEPDKWGTAANKGEEVSNINNVIRQMYGPVGSDITYKFNGTIYGALTPLPGLSLEGTANFVPTFNNRATHSRLLIGWDYVTNKEETRSDLANATVSNSTTKSLTVNTELLARYNTDFNKSEHDLGVILGYTTSHFQSDGFSVSKKGATDWSLDQLSTYELLMSAGSSFSEWALQSYFGRVNYAFKDRYLLEANLRIDGSSRFAAGRRYGYFPSFSAGWRISEEKFMKQFDNLSNLKLRASWGQLGNNASGNYDWQALYAAVNVVMEGNPVKGLHQAKAANENLKWETTTTTNVGIDFGVFNNKLSGSFDIYDKFTDGILFTPTQYLTMGTVPGATQNIAQVRNRGLELSLTYMDKIGDDFNFSITTNWAYNKNKVVKYKGKLEEYWIYDDQGNKSSYYTNRGDVVQSGFGGVICEGHPIGETSIRRIYKGTGTGYTGGMVDPNAGPKDGMIRTEADMDWVKAMLAAGYKFAGVKKIARDQLWYGDFLYQDYNGDGNYGDANDVQFTGHSNTPKVHAGLNISMDWKGIDLSMIWTGAFGFYLIWNDAYNRSTVTQGHAIMDHVVSNHYFYNPEKPEDERTNINGKYPRLTYGTGLNNNMNSNWYEYKGDYVKLKNIQIGYTLPKNVVNKILLSKLRAYVSMDNILTFTKYPGLDPELGTDMKYPLMKQIAFGIQASF